MVMLLTYLRESDARLQWRQPWATVHVDVTVSARHLPREYDSDITLMAVLASYIVFAISRSI